MEKLRHREVYESGQGHIAGSWLVELHDLQTNPLTGNPEHLSDNSKAPAPD